jgi:hypothetical protein
MEKAFIAWCESTERDIALAANPNLDYEGRATAGWPLTRLQDALMLCGVYACIVLVGLFRYLTQKPSAAPAKAADEGKISLAESFRREPIKYVQTVYNSVQVRPIYLLLLPVKSVIIFIRIHCTGYLVHVDGPCGGFRSTK